MEGLLTTCQMQKNFIEQKELLWCERTQDMSGYVPDITSPLLDEQIQFEFSTAQYGNDIKVQNLENPSSEECILGDSFDAVLNENSNMFDNTNYSLLDTKIRSWLPKISNIEINEFAKTRIIEDNGEFHIHNNVETPPIYSVTPKLEKKLMATVVKKPSSLSIFDCEEPIIKEDLESLSSCCTDNKLAFELRDDMEVAEEVIVTTEYSDKLESKENPFLFNSTSLQCLNESKVEHFNTTILREMPLSPRDSSDMETPRNVKFDVGEDFLYAFDPVTASPVLESNVAPKLHLNISAAMATSNQLLLGDLADTPDVLKPVLSPGLGFDLVNYLLTNNCDSNNNSSTASSTLPSRSCIQRTDQRKGKSQLSLAELKESQNRNFDVQTGSIPGSSIGSSSSKRPTRTSTTKFKKKIQDGLLDVNNAHHYSIHEYDSVAKSKCRRAISSCSKKRLNLDSNSSSVSESALKYRERRDRNNISSKRSRQKRKIQQELTKFELKELEEENTRLKRHSKELQLTLHRVHIAWKDYLKKINKGK